ncbi:MAG: hypothetical protein HY756_00185 [Nitrospirae bacterium]|nr:hypothetical protein [Nitrospirota bacterium]
MEAEKQDIKDRFAWLPLGLSAKWLSDKAFDYVLYPYVIYKTGILTGGIVMTFLSFITCFLTIKLYDITKKDWLGIESIKEVKNYDGKHKAGRLASWMLKHGEPAAFAFLSIQYDPFITTAYMRHGAFQFNGMTKRDWKIFLGSVIIANGYWTLACYTGITVFEWVWVKIVKLTGV